MDAPCPAPAVALVRVQERGRLSQLSEQRLYGRNVLHELRWLQNGCGGGPADSLDRSLLASRSRALERPA